MPHKITGVLSLDDKNFKVNMEMAEKSTNRLEKALSTAKGSIKAFVGVSSGVKSIVKGLKDVTTSAISSASAGKRLDTLMLNVDGTTADQIASVKGLAKEIEKKTAVDSNAQIVGASQLAAYQLQASSIKTLMNPMVDLAVGIHGINVSQEQMTKTASMLANAFNGQIDDLEKVGLSFDENQMKIMSNGTEAEKAATLNDVLSQTYGGLASEIANTGAGAMQQLKINFESIKETIGSALLPRLIEFSAWFQENMPQIEEKIKSLAENGVIAFDKLLKIMDWILNNAEVITIAVITLGTAWLIHGACLAAVTMAYGAKIISQGISIIADKAETLAIMALYAQDFILAGALKAVAAAQWLWNTALSLNPIALVIIAVVALGAVIYGLVKYWDDITAAVKRAWDWLTKWNKTDAEPKQTYVDAEGKGIGIANRENPLGGVAGFAVGTNYAPGGVALVGERGPELVNLPRGSQVVPNHKLGSVGGNNIVININGTNKSTEQIVNEMVPKLRLALGNM